MNQAIGGYKVNWIYSYHYLCSTPETEVLLVKPYGGEESLYYVQKDLVGSWVVITDHKGAVVDRHSFDAWGKRRCGDTCNTFWLFRRGYGGHEEMPEFGLINMNGRVYDPLIAMFLSPDPYIQAPDLSQSYNRYGYCLNNPFKYTDPSGEFWHIVIGAAVGGVLNWAANGAEFSWTGLSYCGVGLAPGAMISATGGSSLFLQGVAVSASGFLSGSGNSLIGKKSNGQDVNLFGGDGVLTEGMIGSLQV